MMSIPSYTERLGVAKPDVGSLVERYRWGELKLIDLLVAVLLEGGGPMPVEDVAARLEEVGVRHWNEDLGLMLKRSMSPSPEVHIDDEGRFALAILDPSDRRLRRRLNNLDPPPPEPPRSGALTAERIAEITQKLRAKEAADREEAALLVRVLAHGIFEGGELRAVALLDPQARKIDTFVAEDLSVVPERLEPFDLVVAIAPGRLLEALGTAPDSFRLVDIDRPQKTRQLNQRGRRLRLTNEMLISATLGRSRPLGEEGKYRAYLEKGHLGRLRRRLEADVKALWSYYRFGVLNRAVRLRWGFVDEWLPAEWALPGDLDLQALSREAFESGKRLQVVVGSPPGWPDPWERSVYVEVVRQGSYDYALRPSPGVSVESEALIFEARPAEPQAGIGDWAPGRILLQLPLGERDLLLQNCIALDPEVERRLELAPLGTGGAIKVALDPDELDDLLGQLAFAANHAEDRELQELLDEVYGRLAAAEGGMVN